MPDAIGTLANRKHNDVVHQVARHRHGLRLVAGKPRIAMIEPTADVAAVVVQDHLGAIGAAGELRRGNLNRGSLVVGQAELEALAAYDWPGNVRELENLAIKFIAVGSTRIDPRDFPASTLRDGAAGLRHSSPLKVAARKALRRTERELILEALERTHWNRKKAAQDLQISYKSLLYKIKQIGAEQEETLRGESS